MNKLTLIIILFITACKQENKEAANYTVENITIGDSTHTINVPVGEVYKRAAYNEVQSAKTIHINLNNNLKEKISLYKLEALIHFQNIYIEIEQQLHNNFKTLDDANITYLEEKAKSIELNLSKAEILEIFNTELFYMKLIKSIE